MKLEAKTAQEIPLSIPKPNQEHIKEREKIQMIQKIKNIFESEKE